MWFLQILRFAFLGEAQWIAGVLAVLRCKCSLFAQLPESLEMTMNAAHMQSSHCALALRDFLFFEFVKYIFNV